MGSSGITPGFPELSLTLGHVRNALLALSPLYSSAEADFRVRLALPAPEPEGPDGSFTEGFDLVSRFGPVKGVHGKVAAQLQITELTSGITRMLSLPAPPHSWRRAKFYAPGRVVMAWPARFTSSDCSLVKDREGSCVWHKPRTGLRARCSQKYTDTSCPVKSVFYRDNTGLGPDRSSPLNISVIRPRAGQGVKAQKKTAPFEFGDETNSAAPYPRKHREKEKRIFFNALYYQ